MMANTGLSFAVSHNFSKFNLKLQFANLGKDILATAPPICINV